MELRDQQRLRKILEYCEDIQATVRRHGASYDAFMDDRDYQHAVSFCVLQIGELVGGLSEEYRKATKSRIQWQEIKGMRNIIAHNYGSIDLEIVWDVATINVPELGLFCRDQLSGTEL